MGSGEEAGTVLSDSQQAVLTAVCDTVVPSLPRDRDPEGLWGRKASDIGVDAGAAQLISEIPDPELRGGLLMLLDALGGQGITRAPSQESREQILRNTALADPRAAAGVAALIGMTLFLHYGAPDPQSGQNPNWKAFRYPGPISPPPQVEKPLKIHEPSGAEETLEADVCIVGSGSGGVGDRGGARVARPGRGRARGRRLLQRIRLRPTRAARLPADVLARRPDPDRRRQRQPGGRDDARRRHHDQLDQLPAHAALGPRAVGRARARGRRRVGVSTAISTRSWSASAPTTGAAS